MCFKTLGIFLGLFLLVECGRTGDDVYIEDDNLLRRSYRLEDFLWTGSGDGDINGLFNGPSGDGGYLEPSPRPLPPWRTTTVFRTTTVLSTAMPPTSPVWHPGFISTAVVRPTPTAHWPGASAVSPTTWTLVDGNVDGDGNDLEEPPEPRFWLVTVVQNNASNMWPYTPDGLEARLAKLYRKAFLRQQERHLGIIPGMPPVGPSPLGMSRTMRSPHGADTLRVTIHNVTSPSTENGQARILYWVRVRGRPVPATTAARDMRLVSDAEVAAELGLPVLTKAEPFLKPPVPMAASGHVRDTWILVAAAAAAGTVIVALLALLGLALTQRQRQSRRRRRQQLQQSAHEAATDNAAFQGDEVDTRDAPLKSSQTVGTGAGQVTNQGQATNVVARRRRRSRSDSSDSRLSADMSSASSFTGSAESGGAAPLVRPRASGRPPEKGGAAQPVSTASQTTKHKRKRRHKEGRTVDTVNTALVGNVQNEKEEKGASSPVKDEEVRREANRGRAQRGAVSPTSYLSMPSVKAFPRAVAQPEPLTRVLGPASNPLVDDYVTGEENQNYRGLHGVRHSSLEGDPGVLGPVVWGLRCHRMRSAESGVSAGGASFSDGLGGPVPSLSPSPPQLSSPVGAAPGRMRRRFHELLDDALSLFGGSRSTSQDDEDDSFSGVRPTQTMPDPDNRVQSAVVRHVGPYPPIEVPPRPKTTGAKRPATAHDGISIRSSPRGAWSTAEASPTSGVGTSGMRPLSAGPFHRPSLPLNTSQSVMEPVVDSALVLADARLPPTDPAVPLIAAIKRELSRFGGPDGSSGGGGGGRGGRSGCGTGMFAPPLPGSAAAGE